MYTGLSSVQSSYHFVLPLVALVTPVLSSHPMASAGSWWVHFGSSELSFLTLLPGASITPAFCLWSQCFTLPPGPLWVFSRLLGLLFMTTSGSNSSPDPGTNLDFNLGLTTHHIAFKKLLTQTPTCKPRKASPQSWQGKWIHDIFDVPLKIYNPHHTTIFMLSKRQKKNRATSEEINVADHEKKLCRSHPGSIIFISLWTNFCDYITRNLQLSEEHWDVYFVLQFHEIGLWLDGKEDKQSKKVDRKITAEVLRAL